MTPRTTIREVAAAAGVSIGTASRALSGNGSIAPHTRSRVLDAAATLDYQPNSAARTLRSNRSRTIGLLIPDVRNPYFSELAHVVEQDALTHGLTTVLCNGDERSEQMEMYVDVLRSRRVDGVITAPFQDAAASLETLRADGIPVVFIDRRIPGSSVPSVTSATANAIDEAVALFAAHGHDRIGCIAGPVTTSTGAERRAQVAASAQRHRIDVTWHSGEFREDVGETGARAFLDAGIRAILASDAQATIGAVRACQQGAVRPGADVHLIGFDDLPVLALAQPPLTVIRQDITAMARTAVDLLLRQRRGESVDPVQLPAQLIVRDSAPRPIERIPA